MSVQVPIPTATGKPVIPGSPMAVFEPRPGSPWADTMVLNPSLVEDPDTGHLHMLFRATGPWPEKRMAGAGRDPYPIFLGYAVSRDRGRTWQADWDRPALAPALEYDEAKIRIQDHLGRQVVNYSNGCLEDPRIMIFEGKTWVTLACRMFPPGPYWESGNQGRPNRPDWALANDNPHGRIAARNATVTVLWQLDLKALSARDYDRAFTYVGPLTDGRLTCNRNVSFFPERLTIGGRKQIVLLHRPDEPQSFKDHGGADRPAVLIAAADKFEDFTTERSRHRLLFKSHFPWEAMRVGASYAPIRIDARQWLLANHAKKDDTFGYTQSFMILEEQADDFPRIVHRSPERFLFASEPWEMPDRFGCPCIFAGGGVRVGDELVIAYGAADQKVGVTRVSWNALLERIRRFDHEGRPLT